jgi:hypothetical protein
MSTTSATAMLTPSACISGISADDPYALITRCLDSALDGQLRTLAHLSGGSKLDSQTYRFPYEIICRLAGRQQRGERFEINPDTDTDPASTSVDGMASRLCPCGKLLTSRADAKTCSPKCRQQVSRSNPERIAQKPGSRSVTAMNIPATPLSHLITANRRADGSLRDTFSDLPTSVLLARASRDSEEFNRRQALRGRV